MQRIAIYGKGGIGKSVIATSLSATYALQGKRVLHIGCDPKHDSTMRLTDSRTEIVTVLETLGDRHWEVEHTDFINKARHGIDCCEAGGPSPGVGCAGRGVATTLEFFERVDLFGSGEYDVVVFDVLGDVVCGGFAAPLRAGFAEKVLVVTSEEPMSLYAANNISKAVCTYSDNGVVLAGMVANLQRSDGQAAVRIFTDLVGASLLASLERDPLVVEADRRSLTVVEHAPESEIAARLKKLADALFDMDASAAAPPMPLSDKEFRRLCMEVEDQ